MVKYEPACATPRASISTGTVIRLATVEDILVSTPNAPAVSVASRRSFSTVLMPARPNGLTDIAQVQAWIDWSGRWSITARSRGADSTMS